ncbi:MAG: FAD-dependent monooxygenase, partial [Candidatus Thorarchaeota archaeon]|nr:FAD-dependent monooxygenase [Candidatus Thorarchaeota archaeon]
MYDVAIVGAGPAGATAARFLGKMGYRVILIDRDTFPRDKPCGGGFAYGLVNEFGYLKRREKEFLQGICKVGVLHSPNRRIVLRGKVDMAVALRYDFDNVIFESAIETGIKSITGQRVKVIAIKADSVEIGLQNGENFEARVVVGADGVGSIVAREYGLHRRWPSSAITACRVAEVPEKLSFIDEVYTENKDYHFWANLG